MRPITWTLLVGPPCVSLLTWLLTRGWTSMMMRGRTTPRIVMWQKYDFWIILAILYVTMFTAALVEHKL
jgi:hypothetical protein